MARGAPCRLARTVMVHTHPSKCEPSLVLASPQCWQPGIPGVIQNFVSGRIVPFSETAAGFQKGVRRLGVRSRRQMTLKLPPACLNDMQQYMNILVLKSNLKYFRIFTKFSFSMHRNARQTGSLRKCAESNACRRSIRPRCVLAFHQAAIGENANLKRRPMCVRGFPELLKSGMLSFPARTHTICTARRVRPSAFEDGKCGPAPPFI
ncbi:Hypothetical_protein [Hexamita inflata]|uniref:Hypothetical_protein n=1 Tax=Hexamita inflata TaxID=28002 RepID=A0AA86TM31_9EUKA|nr:Hypothetical protein HINF_LOCUS9045 [Hexamita inflata]